MHAPGLIQQQARVRRHGQMVAEDVLQRGHARAGGMGGLAGLGELLGVADQDEVPGRAGYQDAGQRHLAGLVDKQRVHAALELRARPEPGGAGPDVQVAVPQAGLQGPVLQAGRSGMQVGGVLAGALADARAGHAQLAGACDDLAEQVVDDGVRGAGDADRVPPAPVKVSRRA